MTDCRVLFLLVLLVTCVSDCVSRVSVIKEDHAVAKVSSISMMTSKICFCLLISATVVSPENPTS